MADTKTTALTAATSWAIGDLLYMVRDPAGTPVSRKITCDNFLQNLVCAANSSLLKSTTGYSLTGSNAQSMIDLAGALNTTGSPAIIKVAISNTASGGSTKFLSLLAGAAGTTEIISFSLGGNILVANGGGVGVSVLGSPSIGFPSGAETQFRATANYLSDNAGYFGWRAAATRLYSDASNQLDFRNSANAQTFRLYGTYTDASNYRRLITTMSTAGVAEIKPDGAGTGASGNVLHISGLPTSNPGPGILWNNSGTPAIGT